MRSSTCDKTLPEWVNIQPHFVRVVLTLLKRRAYVQSPRKDSVRGWGMSHRRRKVDIPGFFEKRHKKCVLGNISVTWDLLPVSLPDVKRDSFQGFQTHFYIGSHLLISTFTFLTSSPLPSHFQPFTPSLLKEKLNTEILCLKIKVNKKKIHHPSQ